MPTDSRSNPFAPPDAQLVDVGAHGSDESGSLPLERPEGKGLLIRMVATFDLGIRSPRGFLTRLLHGQGISKPWGFSLALGIITLGLLGLATGTLGRCAAEVVTGRPIIPWSHPATIAFILLLALFWISLPALVALMTAPGLGAIASEGAGETMHQARRQGLYTMGFAWAALWIPVIGPLLWIGVWIISGMIWAERFNRSKWWGALASFIPSTVLLLGIFIGAISLYQMAWRQQANWAERVIGEFPTYLDGHLQSPRGH
jgi:hypothetical protein